MVIDIKISYCKYILVYPFIYKIGNINNYFAKFFSEWAVITVPVVQNINIKFMYNSFFRLLNDRTLIHLANYDGGVVLSARKCEGAASL